jgi:UDP-N-acetylglucosamine 4-epimerase
MSRYDTLKIELQASPCVWLVTGAAGFIGSHLVEQLLRLGQHVRGLDNFATGRRQNLNEVRHLVPPSTWKNFTFIEGDICDPVACQQACSGVDFVLHQAALGSVPRSLADPMLTHKANVDGFLMMLVAARDAKVRRFVYASSSSVYGDHPALPKTEQNTGWPLSPYAATKVINETYARVFGRCYNLQTVGLRYFNVFGPRQDPDGPYAAVIPLWIKAVLLGKEIVINGDGSTSRDFCYIANVVQANILAAAGREIEEPLVVNIAAGTQTTLLQLLKLIEQTLTTNQAVTPLTLRHRNERAGDVRHSLANIGKAQSIIGYNPTHDLKNGLLESNIWFQNEIRKIKSQLKN